jgi:hypothetical protein
MREVSICLLYPLSTGRVNLQRRSGDRNRQEKGPWEVHAPGRLNNQPGALFPSHYLNSALLNLLQAASTRLPEAGTSSP